jgi:hypothetical protein
MADGTEATRDAPALRDRRIGLAIGDLDARLAALPGLTHEQLRSEWRRLHRADPPRRIGREVLELGIAWRLQERVLGGISAAVRRRLSELAHTLDRDLGKARTLRLKPGAKLVREWQGETHDVLVLEDGFAWRGKTWASLSVIAREITGTRWSGPRFFGLTSSGSTGRTDAVRGGRAAADEEPRDGQDA